MDLPFEYRLSVLKTILESSIFHEDTGYLEIQQNYLSNFKQLFHDQRTPEGKRITSLVLVLQDGKNVITPHDIMDYIQVTWHLDAFVSDISF